MQSSLVCTDAAIGSAQFPAGGTPAGTLTVRAADLRVHSARSVTVAGMAPAKGEETGFFRPVLTAPAFVKRDGTVLADAWLPDLVRLGGLEAHLGDGVIDEIAENAVRNGRLRPRERRRLMSYPLVIRLVIAMTLLPGSSYSEAMRDPGRAARGHPVHPGLAHPHRENGHRMAAADSCGDHGGDLLARRRPSHRRR